MDAVAIRLQQVSKAFRHPARGAVAAVREVSLTVAPAEFLTLLGPSGCGKTTTLRLIAGFERPDAGRIFIGEADVTDRMANQRNIGFVFQNYALFPHLSVFENVAYGLRVRRRPAEEILRRVGDVLSLVGLEGHGHRFPHQLSGGEQQRVALARAIVIEPQVLLFDEPLSNLDAKLRVHMRAEIQKLQKQLGITTIYVTHDQEEAMAISDRIAVMHQGLIVQEGSAEALYCRPGSEFVAQFIGRTNLLPARVRRADPRGVEVEVAGQCLTLDGQGREARPGDRVRLLIRPEAIGIGPPGDGPVTGEVIARTFLGEKVEYLVRAGDATIQVTAYDPARRRVFGPGEPVALSLPPEAMQLLPGGEA